MKIRTLQCKIQQLKIQKIIELSKNLVSPSVMLLQKGTHVEKTGSVLFVHKCALAVATMTKLPICTQEVLLLTEVQKFSSITYMDPLKQILYHNFAIAACILLYLNFVILEDSSFQQYGETLNKFNREIYQWPKNTNLCVKDQNLHCSLFSKSDLKQSKN